MEEEKIMKIIEFPDEGVTVTIPKQNDNKNVYVEKKDIGVQGNYPDQPNIRLVINIAFFVLDNNNKKEYVGNLNPKAKLRIRYNKSDKVTANGKKKKLSYLDIQNQIWVDLKSKNTSSKSKNWEGYGDVETPGWNGDPPVGWGC